MRTDATAPPATPVSALALVAVAAGMVGMSFAAVPLYRLFCEVTGYGGTTQRATAGADRDARREIVVRFDANVSGLPWTFEPEAAEIHVKLGETSLVNFIAENTGKRAVDPAPRPSTCSRASPASTSTRSSASASPSRLLRPGERVVMPVQFFVSPEFAEDRDLRGTRTHHAFLHLLPGGVEGQPVAQAAGDEIDESM